MRSVSTHADTTAPPAAPIRTVAFQTLGCKVNFFDTDAMVTGLDGGFTVAEPEQADALVVNTCAVTHNAWTEARRMVRRYKRHNPQGRVIVTGCYAQVAPKEAAGLTEVDWVLGTRDRNKLADVLRQLEGGVGGTQVTVTDVLAQRATEDLSIPQSRGRTRGFLRVQTGCNYRCTFCIIPYARGNSVSVPLEQVLEQAHRLVAAGHRELVPVGIHIADYGKDLKPRTTMATLLHALFAIDGVERVRLSSIDPHEVDDELIDLVTFHPKMARHLHVAVQAGNDRVLKAMKRRHGTVEFREKLEKIAALNPRVGVGTDIIAGFPTETCEEHAATADLIRSVPLSYLHVFPYSPRSGTPAADMLPTKPHLIRQRSEELRAISEAHKERFAASLVGQTVRVLLEEATDKTTGRPTGLCSEYVRVLLPTTLGAGQGEFIDALVTETRGADVLAVPVSV